MKQTQIFTKTQKNAPSDEVSKNAQLLIKGGFIHKELAGSYGFLPLGLKVLNKINNIIRDEMNKAGGQEILMTALQRKDVWQKTNRWDDEVVDVWFKTKLKNQIELGLSFTHEEPLTNAMKNFVSSYKDLPFYPYQIQTKFRNETRAKSGIMRGREFLMKDLYSFSENEEQHNEFYEKMKDVYMEVYKKLGLGDITYVTFADGGTFSKYSHEFQTITDAGEDIIYVDEEKKIAVNQEVYNDEVLSDLGLKKENMKEKKASEVGNIFTLGYKFSEAYGLKFKNKNQEEEFVFMGSYGIGPSRLMGVIAEIFSDENGLIWPENVTPFKVHLINIGQDEKTEEFYNKLMENGIEVLHDNRDKGPGEKFKDSDLIGIPYRVVISDKSIQNGGFELKKRNEKDFEILSEDEILEKLK